MKYLRRSTERRGGWILTETVVGIIVLTILAGFAAELWGSHLRSGRKLTEALYRERSRTAALLYSCYRVSEGAGVPTIVTELQELYTHLDILGDENSLTIDGEEFFPGACR